MITAFVIAHCLCPSQEKQGTFDPTDVSSVRHMVSARIFEYTPTTLFSYGDKLFPSFMKILRDDTCTNAEITNIYRTVSIMKGDTSHFIEIGKELLAKRDKETWTASFSVFILEKGSKSELKLSLLLIGHSSDYVSINSLMHILKYGEKEDIELAQIWMKMDRYKNMNVARNKIDKALAEAIKRTSTSK